MIQRVSFTGSPIRCVHASKVINNKTVTTYTTKAMPKQCVTEIAISLKNGMQNIKRIFYNEQGRFYKVEEIVNGHKNTYTTDGAKVIQTSEEGVETHLPINRWSDFINPEVAPY